MPVRSPGPRQPPRVGDEPPAAGRGQAGHAPGRPASARATRSGRAMALVILGEDRERAEAAGPPGPAMLEVLRACREVHRAERELRERASRAATGPAPPRPGAARWAGEGPRPSGPAEVMGRRQPAGLLRAQEQLRAALGRAGAAEDESSGEGIGRSG